MASESIEEVFREVLAEHAFRPEPNWGCTCGWCDGLMPDDHRAHVAEQLAARLERCANRFEDGTILRHYTRDDFRRHGKAVHGFRVKEQRDERA